MAKEATNEQKGGTVVPLAKAGAVAGFDYGQDKGVGFENVKGSDLSVPFLAILQSNSPQVEEKDPEGSVPGMIFNTVTKELVDGARGVLFQPVYMDSAIVEWVPREKGGGFVGIHQASSDIVKKAIAANDGRTFGKLKNGDNDLVETHYVYGLTYDDDGVTLTGFAVLSFKSTGIPIFKDWQTAMVLATRPIGAPVFALRARLRTKKTKNEKGTFHVFVIDPAEIDDQKRPNWKASLINPSTEDGQRLLNEGRNFRTMVTSGMAKADFASQAATGDAGAETAGKVPF